MCYDSIYIPHPKLGVDIGRVIIGTADLGGKADTAFLSGDDDAALRTPPAAGSFDALSRLVEAFDGNVWLVSKCGNRVRERSRQWLAHHDFFARTGIKSENLRFCYKRHEKRGHAEELGLTHFVDDRVDVLRHLFDLVPFLYLFGHQREGESLPGTEPVLTWAEAEKAILHSLE